jgi:hypothetical protein
MSQISCLVCPIYAVLPRLSCLDSPVCLDSLFQFFCSSCRALATLSTALLAPVSCLTVMSWPSYCHCGYPVLSFLSCLYYPNSPAVLSQLSFPAILPQHSCPQLFFLAVLSFLSGFLSSYPICLSQMLCPKIENQKINFLFFSTLLRGTYGVD